MASPELFVRHESNPLLDVHNMPFETSGVYNPGVAEVDGKVMLLLRVEDRQGLSHLVPAFSGDGVNNWQVRPQPLMASGAHAHRYEQFGCEDPRLTRVDELDCWVIAYTAYSPVGAAVMLARTHDFRSVERLGMALSPNNKDAALFPRRVRGKWALLHRPMAGDLQHIWVAYSEDLVHWGQHECVLPERGGPWWDGVKVGAGTVPIETPEGWLIVYHGVKMLGGNAIYRLGLALLDLDEPHRVIRRHPGWVFNPREEYERFGERGNIVFTCGSLLRDDKLWMYYGAADVCVALAIADFPTLLQVATSRDVDPVPWP